MVVDGRLECCVLLEKEICVIICEFYEKRATSEHSILIVVLAFS